VADSTRAQRVYLTLAEEEGVVVRYRGSEIGCQVLEKRACVGKTSGIRVGVGKRALGSRR
jgi:hypothetical protein